MFFMIFSPPEAEVWVISGVFERPCAFLARHEQFATVLDISSSHDLYFPTTVEWENRQQEAHSDSAAENETLIIR
jgi:hypothetical protein